MIIGVTHDAQGRPRERRAIHLKVAIGLPAGNGRKAPEKLDRFYLAMKNGAGEWAEHKELYRRLQERYSPVINSETKERGPLRSFDVVFLDDDIERVFQTEYAWWSKSEKRCSGNGRDAERSVDALSEAEQQKHQGKRRIPWEGCGENCPDLVSRRCKPSGSLYFILKDQPRIGAVAAYFTTSYTTIMQIQTSLNDIKAITGGHLRGIPLRLTMRPGKTRYVDAKGARRTGSAWFISLEVSAQDHRKLLPSIRHESAEYEAGATAYIEEQPEGGEDVPVVELTEGEQAAIMSPEFYPADVVGKESSQESSQEPGEEPAEAHQPRSPSVRSRIVGSTESGATADTEERPKRDRSDYI